jgi:hypothetical protein
MLFMSIWAWKSERRDEVKKRWIEQKYSEKIKLVGEWIDITGNRLFVLYEADDPKIMLDIHDAWLDIALVDTVPVMDARQVAKIMLEKMS